MFRPALLIACVSAALSPAVAGEAPPAVLTEAEAVRLALQRNPTVEIARRERNVALIQAERERPAFRPEIAASASQTFHVPRHSLPRPVDEVVLPESLPRLEITLRQPVFQFGVGGAPARRAEAMAEAARSEYRRAELDLVLQVREAYLAVRRAQAMARIAEQGAQLARANVTQARLLRDRGLLAEVDVLEAERTEAEAEARLAEARNGVELARASLNRLLGREPDFPLIVAEAEALPEEPGPLEELTRSALARRPEVAALRHNIQAAEAGVRLARAARLPRVEVQAGYSIQRETALLPESFATAGVTLTAPLFEGGARRQRVQEAEERLAQLRAALAALEQGIALEVQRQRLAMAEARARLVASERAIAAAEKAYEITRLRLELGRATQPEVENARLALERARADRALAWNDIWLARVRLDRAIGLGP